MKQKIRIIHSIIFLLLVVISTTICLLIWKKSNDLVKKGNLISHTNKLITCSEKVISLIKDIESGQRGYLITHDSIFLEPYLVGKLSIDDSISSLRELSKNHILQLKRIDTLIKLKDKRILIIDKKINEANLYFNQNWKIQIKEGKIVMDSIRAVIKKIQNEEAKLLKARMLSLKKNNDEFNLIFFFLIGFLGAFLVISYIYNLKIYEQIVNNNQTIKNLNIELSKSYEEIQLFNEELHASNEELSTSNEELFSTNDQLNEAVSELQIAKKNIELLNSKIQARLANLLENSIDLVCFSDVNGKLEYMNKSGRKLMGIGMDVPENEIDVRNFHTLESWNNKVMVAAKQVMETGFWEGESEVIHQKTGKAIPVWQQFVAHKNQEGGVEYLSVITKDLTQIREKEIEIFKNEQRYRLLFQNNPQPMWIYDVETGSIIEANIAAVKKYGYSKDEFEKLKLYDFCPDCEKSNLNEKLNSIENDENTLALECKHLTKNHQTIIVEIYSYGFDLNGRKVRLMMSNDITENKKNEENILKINSELLAQNDRLDKFVYIISHNIRGPIATLLGLINMLSYEKWPPKTQEIIDNMQTMIKKLDGVIIDLNKILSLKNNLSMAKEKIELSQLINDIFQMLKEEIQFSKVKIDLEIEQNDLVTVKSYVHSIVLNLITNSIKYRNVERPLQITIGSKKLKNEVLIYVSDNGLGIDLEKDADKLFGLYKRFHFHVEGKGIGLHLVKTQTEALGGKIEVESKIDVGTTFKIFLPINDEKV